VPLHIAGRVIALPSQGPEGPGLECCPTSGGATARRYSGSDTFDGSAGIARTLFTIAITRRAIPVALWYPDPDEVMEVDSRV
jgi:hypothetical protein